MASIFSLRMRPSMRLAVKAYEEKTGARGLVSAVEKVLLKFEKRLPSTDIQKLVVTRQMVEDPEGELDEAPSGSFESGAPCPV